MVVGAPQDTDTVAIKNPLQERAERVVVRPLLRGHGLRGHDPQHSDCNGNGASDIHLLDG